MSHSHLVETEKPDPFRLGLFIIGGLVLAFLANRDSTHGKVAFVLALLWGVLGAGLWARQYFRWRAGSGASYPGVDPEP